MADRRDLDFSYTLTDRIVRLSLGEFADFSGAKYDGDFTLSLDDAQLRKYEYVDEHLGIGAGRRVLDIGCGWGPLLKFIRSRGGIGLGVTLSAAHVASCQRNGLDAHLDDARHVTRESYGPFDAVTMLGVLEHFCSPQDYVDGRQEDIYRQVFSQLADVLPDGGRCYVQTSVYGPNMPRQDQLDVDALIRGVPERDTDAWYLALLGRQFPNSWLPMSKEQLVNAASPDFRLLETSCGRLDYIETIEQWNRRIGAPSFRKRLMKVRLFPRWLTDSDFRLAFTSGVSAHKVCFERLLLDHHRFVFEKL